jgi:hypothetical protein
MIEVKELRIGNLYLTNENSQVVVKGINTEKESVISYLPGSSQLYHPILFGDLLPIMVTEDKVLELGFKFFEEVGKKRFFQIDNQSTYGILFDDLKLCFYYYHDREGYTILLCEDPFFKYVHHIQNLYFALTGQEVPLS